MVSAPPTPSPLPLCFSRASRPMTRPLDILTRAGEVVPPLQPFLMRLKSPAMPTSRAPGLHAYRKDIDQDRHDKLRSIFVARQSSKPDSRRFPAEQRVREPRRREDW